MIVLKKYIKVSFLLIILIIFYLYIANITLMPKSITLMQGEKLELATLWGLKINGALKTNNSDELENSLVIETSGNISGNELDETGQINAKLTLFDTINVSEISVNVIPKTTVIPLGNSIGLKLYSQGVLIVGLTEINGIKPYENTGLEEGDRIISINNNTIYNTDDLIETVNSSQGKEVEIKYIKNENNKEMETSITPVKTQDNEYKLGLWVRDSAAGVGTATFYETSSKEFVTLGHGITDIDTGELITIASGELVDANVISIKKGEKGNPGEIRGSIEGQSKLGNVYKNTSFGVFGKITNLAGLQVTEKEMEVASRTEIKTGKAQIICEVEEGNKRYYDIEIQKIYTSNYKDNKSMLVKVTDSDLIEKTGGIVQGMSGAPIIQNGKFVGAITHVLVNDPLTGYAVFGDMLLKNM
jgi:stage IV sporulation protein B